MLFHVVVVVVVVVVDLVLGLVCVLVVIDALVLDGDVQLNIVTLASSSKEAANLEARRPPEYWDK